ncbi:hypothetical protein AB1L30_10950 [Bremerella sp. JC817]|uniref:hypothetical protein n=1 Tax=Bremerella sp. JC817 TaxID=3231756 RepID=UPI0034579D5E
MSRPESDIADDIQAFQPVDGEWLGLDELLEELFARDVTSRGIASLLNVFERFPTDDGAGVFWGMVHALESLPDYQSALVQSVQAVPSEFGVIMIHRLLNSGVPEVDGKNLHALLENIAENDAIPSEVQVRARKCLESM